MGGTTIGIFASLRALLARASRTPPPIGDSFNPSGLDEPDEDDLTLDFSVTISSGRPKDGVQTKRNISRPNVAIHAERIDDDLWGVTFAIEYRDARGRQSTRRVTLREMYQDPAGITYLQCYCHERGAPRSFRFDRIQSVIDMDGEVHEPSIYFTGDLAVQFPREVRYEPAVESTKQAKTPDAHRPAPVKETAHSDNRAGVAQRRVARDGLRLLIALARADRQLHDSEIQVILGYIKGRCERAGIPMSEADRDALYAYLRRQYPSPDVYDQCLERLEAEPLEEQRIFLDAAVKVAAADGIEDKAEFEILMELRERVPVYFDSPVEPLRRG